jgi:hypothetical protein
LNEIRGVNDVELPVQDGKGRDGQGALFAIFLVSIMGVSAST